MRLPRLRPIRPRLRLLARLSLTATVVCACVSGPGDALAAAAHAAHAAGGARPAAKASQPAATPAHTSDPGSAQIAGCELFPRTNPWRHDISHARVSPHSAAWVRSVGLTGHLHPDFGSNPSYGIPFSTVPADQPKVRIRFDAYGDESDPGPYPIPRNARIEAGSDRHVLVASSNCHLYELYDARRAGTGWVAASGAIFNLRSNALRPNGWTSADAAGLPILPGLVRPGEVASGHIDHALRFTVAETQRGYIHPATHEAGSTNSPNVPPMGARFRLKASYSLAHFHGAALVILECLKKYGMIVADNGSNWYISGSRYLGWNDTDLDQLKRVPGSAFEVVATARVLH
jgi:hypothetical protein